MHAHLTPGERAVRTAKGRVEMTEPNPTTTEPAPTGEPSKPTEPAKPEPKKEDNRAGGEKAILADLAKEREARKALEARFEALGKAFGVEPDPKTRKTDLDQLTEQFSTLQAQLEKERLGRVRAEVARDKGLPAEWADVLKGATSEEMAEHADRLLAARPQATFAPGTPAPDPSQGARGGAGALEAELKAAQDKGDVRTVIRLKQEIDAQKKK